MITKDDNAFGEDEECFPIDRLAHALRGLSPAEQMAWDEWRDRHQWRGADAAIAKAAKVDAGRKRAEKAEATVNSDETPPAS